MAHTHLPFYHIALDSGSLAAYLQSSRDLLYIKATSRYKTQTPTLISSKHGQIKDRYDLLNNTDEAYNSTSSEVTTEHAIARFAVMIDTILCRTNEIARFKNSSRSLHRYRQWWQSRCAYWEYPNGVVALT